MYKRHNGQISLYEEPAFFGGIPLDPENEWVRLAAILPWDEIEDRYAAALTGSTVGQPADSARIAVGSQIIKNWYAFSDERVTEEIAMNPYLQYFLGLTEFRHKCPFNASSMTRFRQRITPELMVWINDFIIGRDDDDHSGGSGGIGSENGEAEQETEKQGTLILDATCVPQDIRFPTDASILDECRSSAEAIIDTLHEIGMTDGKKPRTYRKKARNAYNSFSKSRKKTRRSIRKAVGQQLRYLRRDLEHITKICARHPEALQFLSKRQYHRLLVIREIYRQQEEMFRTSTHTIADRIVSVSQPWIRPIVRGKQTADVEFGSKVEMAVDNGFMRVEKISWDAFNECTTLQASVESYRQAHGYYPKRVLADTIFRTRENIRYCNGLGIHLNGPKLGRKPTDPMLYKKQVYEEWLESGERGEIERDFGVGKRRYTLDRLMTRLQHTSEVTICATVLVMNLRKKLRLLLRLFFRIVFCRPLYLQFHPVEAGT